MEKHYKTKNGLDIYSQDMPGYKQFCISLNIKAGILYEGDYETGITHYLEHMLFRRLGRYSENELDRELDRYGLDFSGTTYNKFLQFEMTGLIDYFKQGAEIFMNLFEPFSATKEEADKELKIIVREIFEGGDKNTTDYYCNKIAWEGTKLARTIAGEEWKLRRISTAKLAKKKEEIFSAGNMFVYVTGAIGSELENFYAMAEKAVIGRGELRQNVAAVPYDFMKRDIKIITRSADSDHMGLSFDFDAAKYSGVEIELLYDILFRLSTCKVYTHLKDDKGLIYDYDEYIDCYKNIGRIYFKLETEDDLVYDALAATMKMFGEIKKDITDFEYESAVLYNTTYADIKTDNARNLNHNYSWYAHLMEYGYRSAAEEKQLYRSVTKERLQQAACEIFMPDNLCIAFKSTARLDVDKIRRIVLDNLM